MRTLGALQQPRSTRFLAPTATHGPDGTRKRVTLGRQRPIFAARVPLYGEDAAPETRQYPRGRSWEAADHPRSPKIVTRQHLPSSYDLGPPPSRPDGRGSRSTDVTREPCQPGDLLHEPHASVDPDGAHD